MTDIPDLLARADAHRSRDPESAGLIRDLADALRAVIGATDALRRELDDARDALTRRRAR